MGKKHKAVHASSAPTDPDTSRRGLKKAKHTLAKGGGTLQQCLALYGPEALAEVALSESSPLLPLNEVKNLLLWMLTQDLGSMPQWVCVRNKPLVRGAVVVMVPALDPIELSDACGAGFSATRLVKVPKSPEVATLAVTELLQVKKPKSKGGAAPSNAVQALPPPARQRPAHGWPLSYVREFALSAQEQRENGYPECEGVDAAADEPEATDDESEEGGEGGTAEAEAETAQAEAGSDGRPRARLLGVDCEMCYAGAHLQLSRVAVVDEAMRVVMDELVLPEEPITDYNTQYSGITAEMMRGATLSAQQATQRILELAETGTSSAAASSSSEDSAPPNAAQQPALQPQIFLVGHSLENDLRALRLPWPRVLDTSLLYPLRLRLEGPPSKASLRSLTARFLGRSIQQGSGGHSPAEDAAAALELAIVKLERGHGFGMPGGGGGAGGASYESLHAALGRDGWRSVAIDRSASKLARLHGAAGGAAPTGAAAAAATAAAAPPPPQVSCLPCASDEQAVGRALKHAARTQRVVWLTLRGLEEARDGGMRDHGAEGAAEARAAALPALREQLARLRAGVPANTVLLVIGTPHTATAETGGLAVAVAPHPVAPA